ncbi:TIGR02391 family protein [Streptomyces sp. NPDC059092]|uniref:TIGR02391 family protein n=1 Tax=Streptomyces sp. NPDC059092 TaxID=3346725 RepID=UPI0036B40080
MLRYCTLEILAKNPFHASLEAIKSVADRLRQLTGQVLDGARLVDTVLMPGQGIARVAVNANGSGPELDEQKGLANLVKGLFSMYRNPAAHEPRLHRTVTNEELLELLTTLSMVHRRLDGAHVTPWKLPVPGTSRPPCGRSASGVVPGRCLVLSMCWTRGSRRRRLGRASGRHRR